MAVTPIPRSSWTKQAHPRTPVSVAHPYIEVHHSGMESHYNRDPYVVLMEIDRYHRQLGWNGIFYGVAISQQGEIIEARGVGFKSIGAHRATYNDNTPVHPNALCVLALGNFNINRPTAPFLKALRDIRGLVPDRRLRFHGMRDDTDCPGAYIIEAIQQINATPYHDDEDNDMHSFGRSSNGTWYRFFGLHHKRITQSDADLLYNLSKLGGNIQQILDPKFVDLSVAASANADVSVGI